MTGSYDVKVWELTVKNRGGSQAHLVRWSVEGREHSRSFRLKAQADSFRSDLMAAARRGELFDEASGMPVTSAKASTRTCLELARAIMAADWKDAAGTSRRTTAENFAVLVPLLVPERRTVPDGAREALLREFQKATLTPVELDALRTLAGMSLPVTAVTGDVVKRVLTAASFRLDGITPLSASKQKQRRTYLGKLLGQAVAQDLLPMNPVRKVQQNAAGRVSQAVNKREIGDRETARAILTAMSDDLHRDFAKVVYLAGCRPSEVAGLRVTDCKLPASDDEWGSLLLRKAAPEAGRAWTDSGEVRDDKGLKQRSRDDEREVPACPELVALLRARIGDRRKGPVFLTASGKPVLSAPLSASWRAARRAVLEDDDAETLHRMYSLRHLHASLGLNSGLPVHVMAERLGHSPTVCWNIYAKVIASEQTRWNTVLGNAL